MADYQFTNMSVYTPFLANSHHQTKNIQAPRTHTPNKQLQNVVSSPHLFNSAHQQRPITHNYLVPNLKAQFATKKLFSDQKQSTSPNKVLNNAKKLEFKVQNAPPSPQITEKGIQPNDQRYFKARKSSQNNIVFQSRAIKQFTSKQIKDHSPLPTPHKQRKSSCNYDLLTAQTTKQPRFSMVQILPIQEQLGARRTRKKGKGWQEINNFEMDPQLNSDNQTMKINIESPKAKNLHNLQRKHSDNQCTKRTPAFLIAPKLHNKSESTTPRSKFNIQRFRILKQLGRGAYGRVVLAMQKQSGYICAIKILSKRDLRQQNMVEQLVRQIKIQSCLNHPNVIKIYGFFDDLLHFYIVMESALDHRLSDVLEKRKLHQNEAAVIFYQLCTAVSQMHSFTIIHRDLKPENIMLHQEVVKVCDFGWSVYRGSQLRSTFCGTPLYLSPQILMGNSYDQSVDVWTLGIILYEMVIGGSPFGITRSQQLINIVNEKLDLSDKNASSELKQLIDRCLSKNSTDRASVKWLLAQSWVKRGQPQQARRLSLVNQ